MQLSSRPGTHRPKEGYSTPPKALPTSDETSLGRWNSSSTASQSLTEPGNRYGVVFRAGKHAIVLDNRAHRKAEKQVPKQHPARTTAPGAPAALPERPLGLARLKPSRSLVRVRGGQGPVEATGQDVAPCFQTGPPDFPESCASGRLRVIHLPHPCQYRPRPLENLWYLAGPRTAGSS